MQKRARARTALVGLLCALGLAGVLAGVQAATDAPGATDWSMNATVIEACSCPMFCQCYFNTKPAGHAPGGGHEGHGAGHFCRANNAYKVNKGHYGATKLDDAKFWISADLGDDFADGEFEWAVVTFDKKLTEAQRNGIAAIVSKHLFPVKWKSLTTAIGDIDRWEYTTDTAVATLDGGKTAEVRLRRPAASGMTADPIVIRNLKYWGAARNDGFVLMGPNEVQAYRVGPHAFEYKGTNGFMVTFDLSAKDVPKAVADRRP